ncbi:hypothetical protein L1987_44448 [Smallanthus sonchifolius]|uniref:Uncharacterized protein n=1 Tax=Smallanthus sonchifolius TaxID=185202 RepID=A0ACB9GPH3_9ASTR|nr:hypothetical protein L1987_44448 [Smallanthus sonchifolius]
MVVGAFVHSVYKHYLYYEWLYGRGGADKEFGIYSENTSKQNKELLNSVSKPPSIYSLDSPPVNHDSYLNIVTRQLYNLQNPKLIIISTSTVSSD